MGHERSGDCTETGDSAVMPRLPRFLHACDWGGGGDFEASFASAQPGPGETSDLGVFTGSTRGVL
jgi:hypothetical protein